MSDQRLTSYLKCMKNIYLKFIPSFIAFTLFGCTEGVTLKDTAGNKVTFKRAKVSCIEITAASDFFCKAIGVVEESTGNKYSEQYGNWCETEWKGNETEIACLAGLKFGLY